MTEYEQQEDALRKFAQVLKHGGAIVVHPQMYETLKRVAGKAGPSVKAVHYLVHIGVPVVVSHLAKPDDIVAMRGRDLGPALFCPGRYMPALRHLED